MTETPDRDLELTVPVLARVEGEGALDVRVRGGEVETVQLRIYEPPRFFEAFLRGRHYTEPADITARICGICPVAYQMSACHAIERLCGVQVDGPIRDLRRLLYCGEWIESHVLHIGLLHAPDFLGYHSGIDIAADHPDMVAGILALKKTGNTVVEVVGGRPVHPINVRLGGFYRAPTRRDLEALLPDLDDAARIATDLVRWTAGFDFPDLEQDYEFVSLRHPEEYPFNEGRIVSNRGLDIDPSAFEEVTVEEHVAHSTALHSRMVDGDRYHVGPLARYANNADLLPAEITDLAADVGLGRHVTNPFKSIVVRSLETLYAVNEARRLIADYRPPPAPHVEVPARAGEGWGATEAPRGLLYHRYRTDGDGIVTEAQIIPPTSQNQATIEADLTDFISANLHLDHDELQWRCEQTIRNYDPCISCSTHFLTLTIDDDGP